MPRETRPTEEQARGATRRLGACREGWPRNYEAQDEYTRVAMTDGRSEAHVGRVVTAIIDSDRPCPTVAGFRQLLQMSPERLKLEFSPVSTNPEHQTWEMRCEHGVGVGKPCRPCGGTAYVEKMTDEELEAMNRELAEILARKGLAHVFAGRQKGQPRPARMIDTRERAR